VCGDVVGVSSVLHVFVYFWKRVEAFLGEEANFADQASDATSCECSSRESQEEDFVAVVVVVS
jgi:hypothetical protein